MKILVTGGAGFIGSAFVRKMAKKNHVVLVDKLTYAGDLARVNTVFNRLKFYKEDIVNADRLEKIFSDQKPEFVINFAAETHVDRSILDPNNFILSNVYGTLNLLNLALKYKTKKFIQISTDEVYGELLSKKSQAFKEIDLLLPNSPYSASKAGAEMLVRSFMQTYGLSTVILRPSNNYGYWQYPEKLIPLTISKILMQEKIPVYGNGKNIRTWLFVDDCVNAIIKIMVKGIPGEIYNIGGNEEVTNIELIGKILKIMNKKNDLIEFVPDRLGHDFRYAVNSVKTKNRIGQYCRISLDEGLRSTVDWYLSNKKWLFSKKKEMENFAKKLKMKSSSLKDKK